MLLWEGLLITGGGLIGGALLGSSVSEVLVSQLKVWVCRAGSRTSKQQYWHERAFSCGQRLGLINLTASLITAEIAGLCQRSGSFSNWGQVPWELESPSNHAGVAPLSRLPALWQRPFLFAWAFQLSCLNQCSALVRCEGQGWEHHTHTDTQLNKLCWVSVENFRLLSVQWTNTV